MIDCELDHNALSEILEDQHSETAAGLRGIHRVGGYVVLGATRSLVKQG